MNTEEPSFLDLLIEAHIGLDRQGPGSPEMIERALDFLKPWDQFENIADLGCGSGGQTLILAEHLRGRITGLDMFPNFVEVLNQRAKARNVSNRVSGIVGQMENLPFDKHSLDLIWSEGAIDNIGFETGLVHWHNFLKEGGYIAVTCPSWLTKTHPTEVEQFWTEAGSHLDTIDHNIAILQNSGYQFIASFVLPETCWTDYYFSPRANAIQRMLTKYANSNTMKVYAEQNRHEVELYLKYKQHYGYVFYIGRVI